MHENEKAPKESLPAALRHDLRNALTPALVAADILTSHADPNVQRHAQMIITAIETASRFVKA